MVTVAIAETERLLRQRIACQRVGQLELLQLIYDLADALQGGEAERDAARVKAERTLDEYGWTSGRPA